MSGVDPRPSRLEADVSPLDDEQLHEFSTLAARFLSMWSRHRATEVGDHVVSGQSSDGLLVRLGRELPKHSRPVGLVLDELEILLDQFLVRTSHPMFLGYVTPPSLDIAAMGDALAAVTNQNVSFATLSPLGAALETTVVRWLGEIVGYAVGSGGLLTSGGSEANLLALAVARRRLLGEEFVRDGNYISTRRRPRIYCSEQTHHSIEKAAVLLGLGTLGVVRIPVGADHKMKIDCLARAIESDAASADWTPMAVIGNAGTRLCCAFDDLLELRRISNEFGAWFHVDGAYGGFLKLAKSHEPELRGLNQADSITLDPHKLLFAPFDCGALLVRNPDCLNAQFGKEGEYHEPVLADGLVNFADLGVQLGRSMKALKVWLVLQRFGSDRLGAEYDRLLCLAAHLRTLLVQHERFELLGPADGLAICFRVTSGDKSISDNEANAKIRQKIVSGGCAFIDQVQMDEKVGMRVCFANFRTTQTEVDGLLQLILNASDE